MNTKQDNIIVDSSQYMPVYVVQNTGAIQGKPYILAQANVDDAKPVSDNLKRFYENSGILENNFVNNTPSITKPRILKKQDSKLVGNNLKLASFLIPKSSQENNLNKQCLSVSNVVLKPGVTSANVVSSGSKLEVLSSNKLNTAPKLEILTSNIVTTAPKIELVSTNVINNAPKVELVTTNINNIINTAPKVEVLTANAINSASNLDLVTASIVNTNIVPKVEVDRRIVKLKNFPNALKTSLREPKPKMRPRDDSSNPNPTKHTSVQLLKLGETYHSLNQLSDDQMKMVNQALKIFSNPEKPYTEPTYDPVTNTRFIYKVVSPKDLKVVGKNKLKKAELINNKVKGESASGKSKVESLPNRVKAELFTTEYKKEKHKMDEIKIDEPKLEEPKIIEPKIDKSKIDEPKRDVPKIEEANVEEEEVEVTNEVKMTRSGRKVKFPKLIVPETPQQKPKKRNGAAVSCFHCATEFCSLYRLQKHYESHPTHLPAKVHSNLFHCLVAILKSGPEENRTNVFIQQLELLIKKLRSLLPCLLKQMDGSVGKSCAINDDIGSLLGLTPGEYNINAEAITCVKNKAGHCPHNPATKPQNNHDLHKRLPKVNDEIVNLDIETEDCARINAIDKWPTTKKRVRVKKQQKPPKPEAKAKKMRMTSECSDVILELEDLVDFNLPNDQNENQQSKSISLLDDIAKISDSCIETLVSEEQSTATDHTETNGATDNFITNSPNHQCAINTLPKSLTSLETVDILDNNCIELPPVGSDQITLNELPKKGKTAYTQFHSAHFDIRSSPIKTSSAATFRKFQINPEKLGKYDEKIIRPLDLDNTLEDNVVQESTIHSQPEAPDPADDPNDLHNIFKDDIVALACKDPNDIPNDLAFEATKEWICNELNGIIEKSDDNFLKTNSLDESFIQGSSLIEPALLHFKDDNVDQLCNNPSSITQPMNNHLSENNDDNRLLSNQSSSVLNFLDSLGSECLSYPETEIRNNTVDFQLDLFSFNT